MPHSEESIRLMVAAGSQFDALGSAIRKAAAPLKGLLDAAAPDVVQFHAAQARLVIGEMRRSVERAEAAVRDLAQSRCKDLESARATPEPPPKKRLATADELREQAAALMSEAALIEAEERR